jgi:trk system potassium uptake protein TrkH
MYKFAGMSWFNAIGHAFSTVAIGGFSTHDSSIGFYDNSFIEAIAVVFMLLAGVNFGLHFTAWRTLRPSVYLMDSEFKTYIAILSGLIIVSAPYLYLSSDVDKLLTINESVRQATFQVVSIMTTTGFTTTNYSEWPGFLPVLLLFGSFIGGCAGSTAGGMKVIRVLLLFKQGNREIYRLIHPRAKLSIKINRKPVPERVVQAVWGFFAVYIVLFVTFMLLVMMSGVDHTTAFSAVVATLNNLGPGLGEVAENFHTMNDFSKWLLCLAMLMGRLEIFTLLVILTPAFWRK